MLGKLYFESAASIYKVQIVVIRRAYSAHSMQQRTTGARFGSARSSTKIG
jgi:hypothetical protein